MMHYPKRGHPMPNKHDTILHNEIELLCNQRVPNKVNHYEWGVTPLTQTENNLS